MRNQYLGYNPVFESLSQQARKYTNVHINEDAIAYEGEKSQKYLKLIIDNISSRIITFTASIPEKKLRDSVLAIIDQGYKTLSTSAPANLDALIASMRGLFDEAYTEVGGSSSKDKLVPIYDKVKEGMELLMKAYENLKKKYPSEMSQPASLTNCIGYLKSSITSFNTTLEELKKKAV
jgi:hypothetical protein